jgi:predicted nucleic acid-binding protein
LRRCLDSTFLWDLVRGRPDALDAADRWRAEGDELVTTAVNAFEVALGIAREAGQRKQQGLRAVWDRLWRSMPLLLLDQPAADLAGARQAELYASGRPASQADLLVAAIAATAGCDVIVTADVVDFKRIALLNVAAD